MPVKINKLEIENVKRVKAVTIEPTPNGLTIVGGNNNQGKTSILDSIAWALGGNGYKPSQAMREGSFSPPLLKVELSNGLIVERKGKNSTLTVIDPQGIKSGQKLLDSFVEELAINLPKFIESSNKEKANILLQIIGVGERLHQLEIEENQLYQERLLIGRVADQKRKYASELPSWENVPKELISISDLIQQQQEILAKNGENENKRRNFTIIQQNHQLKKQELERLIQQVEITKQELEKLTNDLQIATTDVQNLHDENTEELQENIKNIELINLKVRNNLDKEKALEEYKEEQTKYELLTEKIEEKRKEKINLLNSADLPLPGLSIADGELVYLGQKWDNMSGSQQLKVSTAIVRKLKPDCGFILLDKLEQMDSDTLKEFGAWLEQEGLQAIATRVSTGDECQIIIEDGYVVKNDIQENKVSIENNLNAGWRNGF